MPSSLSIDNSRFETPYLTFWNFCFRWILPPFADGGTRKGGKMARGVSIGRTDHGVLRRGKTLSTLAISPSGSNSLAGRSDRVRKSMLTLMLSRREEPKFDSTGGSFFWSITSEKSQRERGLLRIIRAGRYEGAFRGPRCANWLRKKSVHSLCSRLRKIAISWIAPVLRSKCRI